MTIKFSSPIIAYGGQTVAIDSGTSATSNPQSGTGPADFPTPTIAYSGQIVNPTG